MRLALIALAFTVLACGLRAEKNAARISAQPEPPEEPLRPSPPPVPFPSSSDARRLVPPLPPDANEHDVPVVRITADYRCLVNGVFVADLHDAATGAPSQIESLKKALVKVREDFHAAHPSERFPGALIMDVDETVPAMVVKSAFQSATAAGFPNPSFRIAQKDAG